MSATILHFRQKSAGRNENEKSVHSSQSYTVFLRFPLTHNTAGKKKHADYLPPAA